MWKLGAAKKRHNVKMHIFSDKTEEPCMISKIIYNGGSSYDDKFSKRNGRKICK